MKVQRPRPANDPKNLRAGGHTGPNLESYIWPDGQVATGRQIPSCRERGKAPQRGFGSLLSHCEQAGGAPH
jgi:hypothetical protein